ncbi:MAG: AMP-binding protein [Alphaproteobacteria bacterium]
MLPPVPVSGLSDAERFPALAPERLELLRRLREHSFAPRYTFACGDRLTTEGLEAVRRYERALFAPRHSWRHGESPDWLVRLAAYCLEQVPFYRHRGGRAADVLALPPIGRDDLARAPWAFVPDDVPAEDLLTYSTSGTTGPPMPVLSSPVAASCYLPALRFALDRHGVTLEGGADRVAIALVCAQRSTLTYASVVTPLDGAGFVKINLAESEWRHADDPARFLDDLAPEVLTGDPFSFMRLAELPLRHRPKALVSTAMTLVPGVRTRLESRFGCPVIDVYSMTECRMIAVATDSGHEIVPHDLYVEILAADGTPLPPGQRGEIVVSGGFNPCLPLLRYRTGDFASLDLGDDRVVLKDLQGRSPVRLEDSGGRMVNTIDVAQALASFPLAGYHCHQGLDRSLVLAAYGADVDPGEVMAALRPLFGGLLITVEVRDTVVVDRKVRPFSSEIP